MKSYDSTFPARWQVSILPTEQATGLAGRYTFAGTVRDATAPLQPPLVRSSRG